LLKFLRIFDLADISGERQMPVDVRRRIEVMIAEKIAPMRLGMKIALAKRASAATLPLLMENRDVRVVRECLKSHALTEGHLYKLLTGLPQGRSHKDHLPPS
jgi:hypothetical protein